MAETFEQHRDKVTAKYIFENLHRVTSAIHGIEKVLTETILAEGDADSNWELRSSDYVKSALYDALYVLADYSDTELYRLSECIESPTLWPPGVRSANNTTEDPGDE